MAEPRTLDNPNDIAIREQQRQQRLAMAAQKPRATEIQPDQIEYDSPFIFRFRKIKNGSFAGLWELAVMNPKRPEKVDEIVFDANALPECLEAIGNIFANRGF